MSIGTEIRLGLDAKAVKTGLAKLQGQFAVAGKKIGGVLKAGIGAALGLGAAGIGASIFGIKDMAEFAGSLVDQSAQTGMAIDKLVELREAMRLAGADSVEAGTMVSTFAKNLYEASKEAGPARDALNKLGFRGGAFKDMPINEAFEQVGQSIAKFSGRAGEIEEIVANLFGARRGFKMIGFFKEFAANMELARKNVKGLAADMKQNAQAVDDWADWIGGFKNTIRSFWLNFWKAGKSVLEVHPIAAALKDAFSNINLQEWFKRAGDFALSIAEAIKSEGGIWEWMKARAIEVGQALAKSIADALKGAFSPTSLLKDVMGIFSKDKTAVEKGMNSRNSVSSLVRPASFGGAGAAERILSQLLTATNTGNRSLRSIENKGFPAAWA